MDGLFTPNEQSAIDSLLQSGFSLQQLPPILANISVETDGTFDYGMEQYGGGPGRGMFQFEGSQLRDYNKWGRQALMNSGDYPLLDAGLTTPIMFDIKLKNDFLNKSTNEVIAKKGQTLEEVIFNAKGNDISFREMTGNNITGITGATNVQNGIGDKLIQRMVEGIVSNDEAFAAVPELTGTAPIDYGNQNVANTEVSAELINNNAQATREAVIGDTTEFDKVVKENGNIVADVARDIKRFVLDIFKPKEHKDSAPENPIKSGFGSDAWSLRLLSVKVSQFDTAKKNDKGKYELEMPLFIEVKDDKTLVFSRNFN